jgi:hypothetical protein
MLRQIFVNGLSYEECYIKYKIEDATIEVS